MLNYNISISFLYFRQAYKYPTTPLTRCSASFIYALLHQKSRGTSAKDTMDVCKVVQKGFFLIGCCYNLVSWFLPAQTLYQPCGQRVGHDKEVRESLCDSCSRTPAAALLTAICRSSTATKLSSKRRFSRMAALSCRAKVGL